jgi:hypothetical protein
MTKEQKITPNDYNQVISIKNQQEGQLRRKRHLEIKKLGEKNDDLASDIRNPSITLNPCL